MTTSRSPLLDQLLREALEARLADVHVGLPCKVISYDSEKNTVNLKPLLKRKRRDKSGEITFTSYESLQNVPVGFMRTSKGWFTLPISADDVGMVMFAERSLKDWLGKDAGEEVEVTEDAAHSLSGAWFYPGCYPSKTPINPTNASHVTLAVDGCELHLGEAGLSDDQWVAIAKLVKTELQALRTTINNNNIIFNTMTLPSGMGPVGPPPVSMQDAASINDVKASKVKAK